MKNDGHPEPVQADDIPTIDISSTPDYILESMHTGDFGRVRKKSPKGTGLKIAGVSLIAVALIAVGQMVLGIIMGAAYYHVSIAALDFYPLLPKFTAACILLIAGVVFYAVGRRRIRKSNLASGQAEPSAAVKTQPGPWTCPKCGMTNEDSDACRWCQYAPK